MISSEVPTGYAIATTSICSQRCTDLHLIQPGCEHFKFFYLEMSFGMFSFQKLEKLCRQNDTDTTTTCRAKNCWTRVLLSVCIETWRLPKRNTIPLALPLHGWTKTRRLRSVTVYLDRHTSLYCFGHCCKHKPRRHVQPFSAGPRMAGNVS